MKYNRPKEGVTRIKERFLLFPLEINNEMRWLEKAKWKESVAYYIHIHSKEDRGWGWEPIEWL